MPWYYQTDSRQVVGPISEKALKELNAVGVLAGETQVCREGTDVWTSLNEIFGASSPEATEEADPDEVSGEDPKEFYDQGDSIAHSDESQGGAQKHSFSDRLKREAKASWSDIKRTTKEASVHAQIEKLKHVDLRMALFALGKKCLESGVMESELKEQLQAIRELDATIACKRETSEAEANETKMAALKRMGKDTAKASHAQALTVKRQHHVTELGRQAYAKMMEECRPGLEAEIADIEKVEGNIRSKEEVARTIGVGHPKGWKRITPGIAAAAVVALLLLTSGAFVLRMVVNGDHREEARNNNGIVPFGGSTIKGSDNQKSSINHSLEEAISTIAEVYPELTRSEHIRKLEDISGVKMNSSSNASRAREMVNQLRGSAKITGRSEREFIDLSERKRIELLKDLGEVMSR